MSERDANQYLVDTARMRGLVPATDDLESTQRMPLCKRRERMDEAWVSYSQQMHREHPLGMMQYFTQGPEVPRIVPSRWGTDGEARRAHYAAVRERRKPETVGERKAAVQYARDIIADRQQELIEAGVWPSY